MRGLLFSAVIVSLQFAPGAGFAQYDPAASRAENQLNSLNRSMQNQQRSRDIQQQNQFEMNSMRNQMSRQAPPPLVPNVGAAPLRR